MTAFNVVQVSSMALAACAYVIAYKYGDVGTSFGVAIGYMTVWVPLAIWTWTREDAGEKSDEAS